jgi:dTDP-4-dehydrorhamnose reductase
MKLRILIFGTSGQLGWELNRTAACLGEIVSYDFPQVNFTQPRQLEMLVREAKPHLIINAVAYTDVDRAESEPEVARLVNTDAVSELAETARKMRAGLVHYSTDFVFDGTKGEAYTETDQPKPINVYGQTKLEGEQAVEAAGGNYLILRTSWVYSIRRSNFVTKVLEWARKNETVRIVSDQVGSPTWARLLAEISIQAFVIGGDDPLGWMQEKMGMYHLGGKGSTSRFEWAKEILANDPRPGEQVLKNLEASTTAEFPSPAVRPLHTALNCQKFEAVFGLCLPDWKRALALAMSTD